MNARTTRQPAAAETQEADGAAADSDSAAAPIVHPDPLGEQELTLDEFCRRLSSSDRRVELISGFHSEQIRAGVVKATTTDFQRRYDDFGNKPV